MTKDKQQGRNAILKDLVDFWARKQDKLYKQGLGEISHTYKEAENAKNDLLNNSIISNPKTALNRLEEITTEMEIISNDLFYQQGFCDGVKTLLNLLIS